MHEICLSLISGSHAKFYRLLHPAGSREVCTERGRIRASVTVKWDCFDSEDQAAQWMTKMERQKRRKGYVDARPGDVLPGNYHLYGVRRERVRRVKQKKPPEGGQLSLF